jgi:hypothetical protein
LLETRLLSEGFNILNSGIAVPLLSSGQQNRLLTKCTLNNPVFPREAQAVDGIGQAFGDGQIWVLMIIEARGEIGEYQIVTFFNLFLL